MSPILIWCWCVMLKWLFVTRQKLSVKGNKKQFSCSYKKWNNITVLWTSLFHFYVLYLLSFSVLYKICCGLLLLFFLSIHMSSWLILIAWIVINSMYVWLADYTRKTNYILQWPYLLFLVISMSYEVRWSCGLNS